MHNALAKFEGFTRYVYQSRPQMSFSLGMYYELSDLLQEISDGEGDIATYDRDILLPMRLAIKKGLGEILQLHG